MSNDWVPVHTVSTEPELAVLKSLLEAAGIEYRVHNDRFGSLYPGPRIPLFNEQIVLVGVADSDRARELIGSVVEDAGDSGAGTASRSRRAPGRLRVILEALLFGWFLPARRDGNRLPRRGGRETE